MGAFRHVYTSDDHGCYLNDSDEKHFWVHKFADRNRVCYCGKMEVPPVRASTTPGMGKKRRKRRKQALDLWI